MPSGLQGLIALLNAAQTAKGSLEEREQAWREKTKMPGFEQGLPTPMDMFPGVGVGRVASKFRVPMKLSMHEPKIQGVFNPAQMAEYRFRNRLGESPFRGEANMVLFPENQEAHITELSMHGGKGKLGAHSGGTPQQLQETVGRLAEDLANAGYTKFSSDPISQGRFRLFDRIMRKLKESGKLPAGLEYEQSRPLDKGFEGPAMRRILEERGKQLPPDLPSAPVPERFIGEIRNDFTAPSREDQMRFGTHYIPGRDEQEIEKLREFNRQMREIPQYTPPRELPTRSRAFERE